MQGRSKLAPYALLAGIVAAGPALAAGQEHRQERAEPPIAAESETGARETVEGAAQVIEQMKSEKRMVALLRGAEGLFVVPNLVKGAFIVGAQGGGGVLLSRQNGEWHGPAFYTLGAISIGVQGGGEQGPLAMVLMSERVMQRFRENDSFAVGAEAGFTIVDYSASAQADFGESDVVIWSDKQGAFAGVSVSATDVAIDEKANRAYYDSRVTPQQILSGTAPDRQNTALQEALRQ